MIAIGNRFKVRLVFIAFVITSALIISGCFNEAHALSSGDYNYEISGSNVTITKYLGSESNITIPSTIDGYKVVKIGNGAFSKVDCKTIVIPNGVTEIEKNAFSYSTVNSITIPSSVKTIGYSAFQACRSLKSISLPDSVTSIGHTVFFDCVNLETVRISNAITTIPMNAFGYCSKLKQVPDLKSITSIEASSFTACKSLTSITIPGNVKTIGDSAFYGCSGVKTVTLKSGVVKVDWCAFMCGPYTKTINVPKSVTSIDTNAFGYYPREESDGASYLRVKGATIYGYKGSAAQRYAKEYNVKFLSPDKPGKVRFYLEGKKKAVLVECDTVSQAAKYKIAYKTKKAKRWRYKTTTKTSLKIKRLKKKTKYAVKIRAIKVYKGKAIYGKWSKVKYVKTK